MKMESFHEKCNARRPEVDDDMCMLFRRAPGSFNDMVRNIHKAGFNCGVNKAYDIAFDTVVPSFDMLQERLSDGCRILPRGCGWALITVADEVVVTGETIRQLMVNLVISG